MYNTHADIFKYASFDCGGFCGDNDLNGVIRECYASGEVRSRRNAAGFVGINKGRIESCSVLVMYMILDMQELLLVFVGENGWDAGTVGTVSMSGVLINCFGTGSTTHTDDDLGQEPDR